MSITSMEELTALPVGSVVKVDQHWWSRVEDGFRTTAGDIVEVRYFSGAVATGRVLTANEVPPEVGELWWYNGYADHAHRQRLVTAVDDTHIRFVTINDGLVGGAGSDQRSRHLSNFSRLPVAEHPAWLPQMQAMAAILGPMQAVAENRQEYPDDFIEGLHNLLDEFDDDDDKDRVNNYLSDFGVARQFEHRVDVVITGTTSWYPNTDQASEALGLDDAFRLIETDGSVTVSWRRDVTLTTTGTTACSCEEIDSDDLSDYLPDDHDGWDFEVSCA